VKWQNFYDCPNAEHLGKRGWVLMEQENLESPKTGISQPMKGLNAKNYESGVGKLQISVQRFLNI